MRARNLPQAIGSGIISVGFLAYLLVADSLAAKVVAAACIVISLGLIVWSLRPPS